MTKNKITKSEEETFNLGKKLAGKLSGGEVIALEGDLGAGKTVFSQGLCAGLGYKKRVQSPTFVLMKIYSLEKDKIKQICHIDAYRLNSLGDLEAIGARDYFNQKNTVTVIEWADKLDLSSFSQVIKIKFKIKSQEERDIKIF